MIELLAVLGFPLAGAAVLALIGERRQAPVVNVAASFLTFLAAVALTLRVIVDGPLLVLDRQFFVDPFNVFLVALTAFVGLTTSIFSRPYMQIEQEHGRLTAGRLRLYHSMYQLFNCTMLVALLTNNMGILWVAMEAATLTTVLLVSLYRTPASLEAAWKYFILCGVGIAQALFGTILLYFAAEQVLGAGGGALLWTELDRVKGNLEPTVLSIAFVFLLVGYGTKVGLVPLHNWLPDAHAEGPTPVSAVLSETHHQLTGERTVQRSFDENFAADDRIQRDVEQEPGQHRRYRRRTLGVGVRQPVVQRDQADLGPVADQQEHERERQHGRLELPFHAVQFRPE